MTVSSAAGLDGLLPRAADERLRRRVRPPAGLRRLRRSSTWSASVVLLLAHSFWAFLAAAVLTGVFRALDSGPLEAWFVDTVHASEPGADVDRALAAQGTVLGGGIAAGALVSGGLVWWHPFAGASALVLPVAVFVGLNVVHLVAVLVAAARAAVGRARRRVRGAPGRRLGARRRPRVVREGLGLLRSNRGAARHRLRRAVLVGRA